MACRRDELYDWSRESDGKTEIGKDPSVTQMETIISKATLFIITFKAAAFHVNVQEPDARLAGINAITLFLDREAFPQQRDELNGYITAMVESIKTSIPDTSREIGCAAVVAAGALAHVVTSRASEFEHLPEFDTFCSLLKPLWIGLVDNQGALLRCFLARMSYMAAYMKKKKGFATYFARVVLGLVMQQEQHDEEVVVRTVLMVLEECLEGEWLVCTFISLFWNKGAVHLNSLRHRKQILSVTALAASMLGLSAVLEDVCYYLRSSGDVYVSAVMDIVRNVAMPDAQEEEIALDMMQKLTGC